MITDHAEKLKKLPPLLYKVGAQLYIDHKYPRHIFIETTASCNLSCGYCPREKIRKDMDFGLLREIVDEASGYGPRSFSLHLFGEPLLYPRIFESIEYIRGKNKNHVILLTTNGTLLNKYADEVCNSGVDKVLWTVRPEVKFTPETREKLRKFGRFTARIIEEVTSAKLKKEWEKWPNLERRSLHNYGGEIELSQYSKPPIGTSTEKRWPCYHLWLAPAVAYNGKILICCADPHQKEVIGQFPETSIAQAWKSMDRVRESHLQGKYEGICKDCDIWKQYPSMHFKNPFKKGEYFG